MQWFSWFKRKEKKKEMAGICKDCPLDCKEFVSSNTWILTCETKAMATGKDGACDSTFNADRVRHLVGLG